MWMIFHNGGEGDGLLMSSPIENTILIFKSWRIWKMWVNMFKAWRKTHEEKRFVELSPYVDLTFLGESFVLTDSESGFKYVGSR